jgi:hypothetical protein
MSDKTGTVIMALVGLVIGGLFGGGMSARSDENKSKKQIIGSAAVGAAFGAGVFVLMDKGVMIT